MSATHDRRMPPDDVANINRRLDVLEEQFEDYKTKLDAHIRAIEGLSKSVEELVILWRGSKLMLPIIAGSVVALTAFWEWAKPHIRL